MRVGGHVNLQGAFLVEGLLTLGALERTLTCARSTSGNASTVIFTTNRSPLLLAVSLKRTCVNT